MSLIRDERWPRHQFSWLAARHELIASKNHMPRIWVERRWLACTTMRRAFPRPQGLKEYAKDVVCCRSSTPGSALMRCDLWTDNSPHDLCCPCRVVGMQAHLLGTELTRSSACGRITTSAQTRHSQHGPRAVVFETRHLLKNNSD